MGSGVSFPLDKKVVVVGGGYAGVGLCMKLLKDEANFTLIDAKDAFIHNVASVRAIVEPDISPKLFIDYAASLKGHFRQGRVVGVDTDKQEVVLEGGGRESFQILVLCTGCTGPFPAKLWESDREAGVNKYREYAQQLKASNKIAIVGGGAVGVEIAAEIKTEFPEKAVVLVHPNEDLLKPGLSQKLQKKLRNILMDRMKVELVLGEKITNLESLAETGPCQLTTDSGRTIEADMGIKCIGLQVNSLAYKEALASSMDERGALKVNEFFQVEGHTNIFAIGDCNNIPEMKLVVTADAQAIHFYENLKQHLNNRPMKPYKIDNIPFKIVVSLGRSSGTGELKNGIILPEFAVTKLKSSGMFMSKYWGVMNQKMPK